MLRSALIILLPVTLAACEAPSPPPKSPQLVRAITVGAAPAAATYQFAGEVKPRHESRLAFRLSGKLIERQVEMGARVRAGQALAQLDRADLRLAARAAESRVAAAQTAFDQARANLARYTTLREKNFISDAELERHRSAFSAAQATLDSARAEADLTRNQLEYTTLHAEFDGVITALDAEPGQVVGAGQPVMQLAREGDWEIALFVPEDMLGVLRGAQSITVSLWAVPNKNWPARVREIAPSADPLTRTFAVRLTMPEAMPLQLGMSASVRVQGAPVDARIRLPLAALIAQGSGSAVWVIDPASQTVRRQAVVTGATVDNEVLIESGVPPGAVVVSAGAQQLHDNQPVRVLQPSAAPTP